MTDIPTISRPPKALCDALAAVGSATAAGELSHLGVRDAQIRGPVAHGKVKKVAGPALTLQFMPQREAVTGEYDDPEKQLHRHVLYQVEAGDMVVVDARGDMSCGVFGEMMLTYLAGKGGAGVVIDGCIRDSEDAFGLDLGYWIKGTTPNFHIQTNLIPFAVNVPIACGNTLVYPGDIIVADRDGAVVVPIALAEPLLERASKHAEWEGFSKMKLSQGADLRKYYPLRADAQEEFEAWRAAQGANA